MILQAFRRSFQNEVPASEVQHLFSDAEQLIGFRCRQTELGVLDLFAVIVAHGADIAALFKVRDDVSDDPGDRRLAVGTGNTDRIHVIHRVAIEGVAEVHIGILGVFDSDVDDFRIFRFDLVGIDDTSGAVFNGFTDETVTVVDLSLHCKKDGIIASFS